MITVAAGFPTAVNPLIQDRLVPVFIDIELGTYNCERWARCVRPLFCRRFQADGVTRQMCQKSALRK
jgi:hypothetical protein